MPAFQATCAKRLRQIRPSATTRPVRVFSPDESRFGLLAIRRRRLPARGVQPLGSVPHLFEWFSLYGAVAPTPGDRCLLAWPSLSAAMSQLFSDAFAQPCPDRLHLLRLDHSGARTSPRLPWPANVHVVFLPPYGPQLNPIERVWRDLKDDLAWQQGADLTTQQEARGHRLQADEVATLQSLTGYPDLVGAIPALRV